MRFGRKSAQAAVAAIVAAIVTTGFGLAHDVSEGPPPSVAAQQLPPMQEQPLIPTDLQTVETGLGPFGVLPASNSATPDTMYPAVLLASEDGALNASKRWTVSFSRATWSHQQALWIVSLTVHNGYATFSTGPARVFTVRTNQPFVLAAVPQYVWVIDDSGKQWSISTSQAIALRHRS